jgi:hypothetical protein
MLQLQANDRAVVDQPLAAILGKQRRRARPPLPNLVQRLDRLAPSKLLRFVDLI